MNSNSFIDLCHEHFGRKITYTDVDRITKENVVDIVGKTISVLNYSRPTIWYLYNYYEGNQPVHYREKKIRPGISNKTCENHTLEVVRFSTSQTCREPVQYVSRKTDEKINNTVDKLNGYMKDAHRQARGTKLGNFRSIIRTTYKVALKGKSTDIVPFRIHVSNPLNTIVVRSAKDDSDMLSAQVLEDGKDERHYQYYSNGLHFAIKVGRVTGSGVNGSGGTPIVEYPNNPDRLSDIEVAITSLNQISKMQSDRMDGIEQLIRAFMLLENRETDEKKSLQMCGLGAVEVRDSSQGMQLDIKLMTTELNQQQTQVAKDDVYRQMLITEGMSNRQQNAGGDTRQMVHLRDGWDFVEQRARLDEPFTIETEKEHARIVSNIIRRIVNDVSLVVEDFDVEITRNSIDNMLVKAQTLNYLLKNKIHPLIAITVCRLPGDPERVWTQSKPYMDAIFKMQEQLDIETEREHALEFLETKQIETVKTEGAKQAFLFLYRDGVVQ